MLAALALLLPAAAAARLSTAAESNLDAGLRQLYELDYEASRASFRKIIEAEPDNPFGYLFEAGQIWWQASAEYGLFKGTPTLQGLFERDIEAALLKAKPGLKSKDPETRADAYFASGMALGTKGQWDILRGRYLHAYFSGKKAVKRLKKCLKIDRNYYDAYLGLGVYDYEAGHLPGVLKLSFLVGIRGDAKRGLERIQLAADKGRYGSRQAVQFLASIYIVDERDYARALPLVQSLRRDFPESPYFQFLELYLRQRLGDWDGSHREAADLFERLRRRPAQFKRKLLSLFCGLSADRCLEPGEIAPVRQWLERAIESDASRNGVWPVFLHLCAGQAADIAGDRAAAVAHYERTLAAPDELGLRDRARRCLARPCGRDSALGFLRRLSRDGSGPRLDASVSTRPLEGLDDASDADPEP